MKIGKDTITRLRTISNDFSARLSPLESADGCGAEDLIAALSLAIDAGGPSAEDIKTAAGFGLQTPMPMPPADEAPEAPKARPIPRAPSTGTKVSRERDRAKAKTPKAPNGGKR